MKKKLIFVAQALWIGGIEVSLVNLLNQLDYEQYDVTVLILRNETNLAGRLPKQCRLLVCDRDAAVSFAEPYRHSRLFHLMEEPQSTSRLRRLAWKLLKCSLRSLEMDLYARYVRSQMHDEQFDTCIIYSDRTAEVAVKAIQANRFLMYYHHGAMRREFHDTYGYRKSDKIIAVSEPLAQKLRAFRPQYADNIISVMNLVNFAVIREKSRMSGSTNIPEDGFHIVSCGRIAPEKGMDLAADACAALVRGGMRDLHWWILGGGPAESALRNQAERLGIESHFHLLGMQDNPYPLMAAADLYVQPSRVEAFGLTILEAAILGRPILTTDTDGGLSLIRDDVNGAVCEANAASIAEKIKALRNRPERLKAYQTTWEDFDFSAWNAKRLKEVEQFF